MAEDVQNPHSVANLVNITPDRFEQFSEQLTERLTQYKSDKAGYGRQHHRRHTDDDPPKNHRAPLAHGR